VQLPLFDLPSTWSPPLMAEMPEWTGAGRVGIDIETYDPNLKITGPSVRTGGHIAGISFAIEDGPCHYLPMRHEGGNNLDPQTVLRYFRNQAKNFKGILVGANINYDLDYMAEEGINFNHADQRDVQIADPLIDELHFSYSLDAIAKRHGLPGKDEMFLRQAAAHYGLDPKKDMHRLPAKYVGPYAEQDARLPLQVLRRQERILRDEDLWPIYQLECKLQPVLLRMRRRGVRIDLDQLDRVEAWARKREQEHLDLIRHHTGVDVGMDNIWTKAPLVRALTALGVELEETPSGQDKLDQETLNAIDHPVAAAIVQCRKVNKLRTTFVQSIRTHMVGDRIHTTFNQMRRTKQDGDTKGARYGRMSSEHPNLQQQSARDEWSGMWRAIYVPDGDIWACADYSKQEPRILTHFAELCGLPRAKHAADAYRNDPKTDNHQMMADLCGIPRTPAKNIYLGLCYSMGGAKLARNLGLPTKFITTRRGWSGEVAGDEAQALLDAFHKHAPFVKKLADLTEEQAAANGFIKTLLGRKCHFPKLADGSYDWCHKALNRLIQGSAADQTKAAVVALDDNGFDLQLQVHDEVDWSPANIAEVKEAGHIMRHVVELSVPSRVDLEIGPNWGEAKEQIA